MSQDLASQLFRPYLSTWLRERVGTPALRPGAVFSCQATILYADLSGFTRLTAAFASVPDGAERLHDALNRCYSALIDTIGAYGGDVPTIAGDALTAWWPEQLDLELARRCAAAMLSAAAALPVLATPEGPFRVELRIGVSAGLVHATLAGLPTHGVHLVIAGPALDAAAAAERAAPPGAVYVVDASPASEQPPPIPEPPDSGDALSWEHFLPPSFAERLRLNELVAEYRRCVPVFATFELPRRPDQLHPLVAQVQAVVQRWGGWLNEIEIGDGGPVFVLLFGAPLARGDDASRAVGCCLELRERGLITRAGVTLGILFVGSVGSATRRVYTAQGDDMNLAAHLMQQAAPGEILVSGRVRHDVMDRYETSPPTVMVTKGHAAGVPVARLRSRAARSPAQVRRYLPDAATLVGREQERATIRDAAAAAAAGQPTLLIVEGESGIGKSCMLQDLFLNWIVDGRIAYSAECSSGGMPTPFFAWRPILFDLCEVDEGAPLRLQRAQLDRAVGALPPELQAGREALSEALGLGSLRPDGVLPASAELPALMALIVALVQRQVARGPLLIVLEDIHWADEPSLLLARELIYQAPAAPHPFCLALSHRPLDGPPPQPLADLHSHAACVRVTVGRLSQEESLTMIRAQLGVSEVRDELRQHVERATEGQPLFIKEYLRVLRQHNLIRIEDDTASLVRSLVTVQVSNSAQGIIQARVDRLDLATRLTLKVAAVLGRSFPLRLLSTIHPARPLPAALREQLDTLVALQIIDLELADPEPVYRFKYGITHEVAYTSLLFGQRRQLHGAVATWYEWAYAEELAAGTAAMAVYDVLIDHLGRAEEWERQATYCRMAAERAARQLSASTALRYIEQALVFTREREARIAMLLLRVALNDRVGNYQTQEQDLEELALLAARGARALPLRYADYFRLRLLLAQGLAEPALAEGELLGRRLRRLERQLEGPERAELTLLQSAVKETIAAVRAALGQRAHARMTLRRALALCWSPTAEGLDRSRAPLLEPQILASRCLEGLGNLDLSEGRLDPARTCYQQALELARAVGDWCGESRARERLGRVQLAEGDLQGALATARAVLTTSNAVGDRRGQALALRQIAAISAARGDYAAAERDAHYALAISAGARARAQEAEIWDELAVYAEAQGLHEEAAAARNEARRLRSAARTQLATSAPQLAAQGML